ncbi:LysR family transcriptional regulator [Gallaecimonas xiamenensis 3-C-1]|uniref:LysR family transcriptional regulator n=1 Tax=Gallaecimonas xiamenensis 3-C-1 TaxID=745411 RepID=K2K8Y4_9GAMM|nr:LysR family transcriptional regulator [Gallaecimonas xiamenensis 3-C-1]
MVQRAALHNISLAGIGIALCSTWCCYQHPERGELVAIFTDYPVQERTAIWSVRPNSGLMPHKVPVFIDFLIERFGSPPYRNNPR